MSEKTPYRARAIVRAITGLGLLGTVGFGTIAALQGASAASSSSVTICHRLPSATEPYRAEKITVDAIQAQALDGHASHTGPVFSPGMTVGWGDIIPPLADERAGIAIPGYNWDAAGQAIWRAGCVYAAASPTPTPTATPAPTLSPTVTPTPTMVTSPSVDGVNRPEPQPVTTVDPDAGSAGNVGTSSEPPLPQAVEAGGGPPTPQGRSAWLWAIPAAFLALAAYAWRRAIS